MTKDLIIGLLAGSMGTVCLLLAVAAWVQERKRNH